MKTLLVISLLLVPMVCGAFNIVPIEIYSVSQGEPYPIYLKDDWPQVNSFYECFGSGNLKIKTEVINGVGTVVEKWIWDFGWFDCDKEGELWSFADCFMPEPPGRYTVRFSYIYNGVVKTHKTLIRWLGW